MDISNGLRPPGRNLALRSLLLVTLSGCAGLSVLAQQPIATPRTFHTIASFSVDADVLRLQTAVAISEPHARFEEFSWLRIYFYAFPLTSDDVAALSSGGIAALERKRKQVTVSGRDLHLDHSRAVLNLLLDSESHLSNVSLETPGLTCTIAAEPATAKNAVQSYQFDGRQVQVKAKGVSVCDLTSISGGKPAMSWDVDVNLPVFARH